MNCTVSNINKYKIIKDHAELIPYLPSTEQTIIDLFLRNMTQKDISKIIGITQGAVASRIKRAQERLSYLKDLKKINFKKFFKGIEKVCLPLNLEIIKTIISTSCQSETAWQINNKFCFVEPSERLTQVKVRHRFETVLELLRKMGLKSEEYQEYYEVLKKIKENLYLLHEVKLPHFDRRPI